MWEGIGSDLLRSYPQIREIDSDGNIYCEGSLQSTIDADPGSGEFRIGPEDPDNGAVLVIKLSSGGDFIKANKCDLPAIGANSKALIDESGDLAVICMYPAKPPVIAGRNPSDMELFCSIYGTDHAVFKFNSDLDLEFATMPDSSDTGFIWANILLSEFDSDGNLTYKGACLTEEHVSEWFESREQSDQSWPDESYYEITLSGTGEFLKIDTDIEPSSVMPRLYSDTGITKEYLDFVRRYPDY